MNNNLIYHKYQGIKTKKHMSMYDRAAQFAPFSALSGYSDKIKESNRYIERKKNLNEEELDELNKKIIYIKNNITNKLEVTIKYFIKDKVKDGGIYQEITGIIKKIDEINNIIILENKEKICIKDIIIIKIKGLNE